MPITPVYQGEARLLRWAHSDGSGRTITLQLPEDEPRHPFNGIPTGKENGQRMQIVCVLIDDHEQPLEPGHARRKKAPRGAKENGTDRREPEPLTASTSEAPRVASTHADKADESDKPRTPLRSNLAAIMCKENEDFQVWLAGKYPEIWDRYYIDGRKLSPEACDLTLKDVLNIASKRALDVDTQKADAFDRLTTDFAYRNQVR